MRDGADFLDDKFKRLFIFTLKIKGKKIHYSVVFPKNIKPSYDMICEKFYQTQLAMQDLIEKEIDV